MFKTVVLSKDNPNAEILAQGYFTQLELSDILITLSYEIESQIKLKLTLQNRFYNFNMFSWYRPDKKQFDLFNLLIPPQSIKLLQGAHFTRLEVSAEGVEWTPGLQIKCLLKVGDTLI
jgi:hypothetical protein